MSFTNEDLDKLLMRFEAEIVSDDKRNIRRCYQDLKTHLLKFDLDSIGCPILLARAYHLMKSFEEIKPTEAFQKLKNHLIVIEDVHEKFFRILHEPDYDVLLYDVLDEWEVLSAPLEIDYSEYEEQFIKSRGQGNYYTLLQNFIIIFLLALGGQIDIKQFEQLKNVIEVSLEGYKYSKRWDVFGLFALSSGAKVYGIRTTIYPGEGNATVTNQTDKSISTAVNRVVASVRNIIPSTKEYDYIFELEREDVKYSGNSIDLALCIAIAKVTKGLEIDPYTSFTGCLESLETGEIGKVTNLNQKLEAAAKLGIRRVLFPNANIEDVKESFPNLERVPISNVSEAIQALEDRSFLSSLSNKTDLFKAKVKKLIILLKEQNIHHLPGKDKPLNGGIQLWFTNYAQEINVDLYDKRLKWVPGGPSSLLKDNVTEICEEVFGDQVKTRSPVRGSISLLVSDQNKQIQVQDYLTKSDDVTIEQEKNCLYRAKIIRDGNVVFVRQFHSGTLRVDGPQDQFEDVLSKIQNILGVSEEAISQALLPGQKEQAQINAIKSVDLGSQWIGTDESGKGDYYGPLVGAAVLVDDRTAILMEELGIKDSKKISDKRVHDLAARVKQVCGERAQIISISPEKYNELYRQFVDEGKNLNTLLAWAHTRGIENIVERYGIEDITVIVDKFADESYIQSKLLEGGRKANLNIIQLPKAEANIAVAAASVLARSEFLKRLGSLSNKYRLDLPKGASDPKIIDLGKSIVKKSGKSELGKVAKLHFKTTKKIVDTS